MDPDAFNAALDDAGDSAAPATDLETRLSRVEAMLDVLITAGAVKAPADPDAIPGEVHVPQSMGRRRGGDGGAQAALVYPLPEPLAPLRVRIAEGVLHLIYRDSKGTTHRHEFPV